MDSQHILEGSWVSVADGVTHDSKETANIHTGAGAVPNMNVKGWKVVTASLSAAVAVLVIVVVYLASITNMGLISTLANNQQVTVNPLANTAKQFQIRYAGYLTITYNSTAVIAVTVSYSFAQQNFTSTHLGTNGRITLAVLPSTLTLTFTSALQSASVHYTVYEQY